MNSLKRIRLKMVVKGYDSSVSVNGTVLSSHVYKKGDRWLTLVHGGLVGSKSWDRQLSSEGGGSLLDVASVLAFDQRGYGESFGWETGSISILAADLAALWDIFGITETIVVGFSLGGFVALEASSIAPDRIIGLFLEGCGIPDVKAREQYLSRAESLLDPVRDADAEAEVRHHVNAAFSRQYAAEHTEELSAYVREARLAPREGMAASLRDIAEWEPSELLLAQEHDLWVVVGDEDSVYGRGAADDLCNALGRGKAVVVKASGHTVHMEQPLMFKELLRDFVRGCCLGRLGKIT